VPPQHGWVGAPQSPQVVPLQVSTPAQAVPDEQQGCPIPPQATQVLPEQCVPGSQIPPPQQWSFRAPQAMQVFVASQVMPEPLQVANAQQVWPIVPHASQLWATQFALPRQASPGQQGPLLPPQAVHMPFTQTSFGPQPEPVGQQGPFVAPQGVQLPPMHSWAPLHWTWSLQQASFVPPHPTQVLLRQTVPETQAAPTVQQGWLELPQTGGRPASGAASCPGIASSGGAASWPPGIASGAGVASWPAGAASWPAGAASWPSGVASGAGVASWPFGAASGAGVASWLFGAASSAGVASWPLGSASAAGAASNAGPAASPASSLTPGVASRPLPLPLSPSPGGLSELQPA
jgi:hypothetical protein